MLSFLLRSIRHNIGYKLLCLFFAFVLHFYAAGLINAHPPHILILPLTGRNLPPNLILDDKNLPSVTLTLDGPTDEINRLTDTTVNAWVDLSHARAGITAPLAVHLSPLPANVTVESDPRPVTLRLQARQSRKLFITADDIGVAPNSYMFAPPVITPREATITGTRESVRSVVRLVAQADPDQAPGAVEDDFTIVALDTAGSPVGDVTVSPPTVHVRMDVVRALARKTLVVSADIQGMLPAPYRFGRITVTPASVTAEGRPEQLAPIGTLTTQPIDVSGATADIVRRVAPIIPAGVTLTPRGPITVTIHVLAPTAPPASSLLPSVAVPETSKP
jgi:YbbR domain-containing protein